MQQRYHKHLLFCLAALAAFMAPRSNAELLRSPAVFTRSLVQLLKDQPEWRSGAFGTETAHDRERNTALASLIHHFEMRDRAAGQRKVRDIIEGTTPLRDFYPQSLSDAQTWMILETAFYDLGLSPGMTPGQIHMYAQTPNHPLFSRLQDVPGIPSPVRRHLQEEHQVYTLIQFQQLVTRVERQRLYEPRRGNIFASVNWQRAQDIVAGFLQGSARDTNLSPSLSEPLREVLLRAGLRSLEQIAAQPDQTLLGLDGMKLEHAAELYIYLKRPSSRLEILKLRPGSMALDQTLISILKSDPELLAPVTPLDSAPEKMRKISLAKLIGDLETLNTALGQLTVRRILEEGHAFAALYPRDETHADARNNYHFIESALYALGLFPGMTPEEVQMFEANPNDPVFSPLSDIPGIQPKTLKILHQIGVGTVLQFMKFQKELTAKSPQRPWAPLSQMGRLQWENATDSVSAFIEISGSTILSHFNLMDKTVKALARVGITTIDQLKKAEDTMLLAAAATLEAAVEIWALRQGPEGPEAQINTLCERPLHSPTS